MIQSPVSSQASTIMRFQRALAKGNVWLAEDSARTMTRPLTLEPEQLTLNVEVDGPALAVA